MPRTKIIATILLLLAAILQEKTRHLCVFGWVGLVNRIKVISFHYRVSR